MLQVPDGTFNGIDLDSLYEYNKEHGTEYAEKDFDKSISCLMTQIVEILNLGKDIILGHTF